MLLRYNFTEFREIAIDVSIYLALLSVLLLSFSGCSVIMAAKQPGKKDINALEEGTPRSLAIAELGMPSNCEEEDGCKVDTFRFMQGYSNEQKRTVTFGHLPMPDMQS